MIARVQPTVEQWKKAEDALAGYFGDVVLHCDGYVLNLRLQRIKPRQFTICVYVNGCIRGEWLASDCEERRRFFRPVTRRIHQSKFIDAMIKIYGKKKLPPDTYKTGTYYLFDWRSFGGLRRHLLAHNTSVRIVEIYGRELPQ